MPNENISASVANEYRSHCATLVLQQITFSNFVISLRKKKRLFQNYLIVNSIDIFKNYMGFL